MVLELKLRKVGNSVGIVLPKEALAHMKVEEGDVVTLTEAPDGSLRITPSSAEVRRQLDAAKDIISRYRNALRELAK